MNKFWIAIIGVFALFFGADKMLGAAASLRQNRQAEQVADLKQVGDVIQTDGSLNASAMKPSTELGKSMQASLAKIQSRIKLLEKDLATCKVENPLDWDKVATSEGRKRALSWVNAERGAYDRFNRDSKQIQLELAKLSGGASGSKLVASTTNKVNQLRSATYDSYEAYIRGVANSELVTHEGQILFVHEEDRAKCESLMKKCGVAEDEYIAFSKKAEQLRAKELGKIKDRMASYPL